MFLSQQYQHDHKCHYEGTAGGPGPPQRRGMEAPGLRGSSFTPVSQNQQNQSLGGFPQLTSDPAASRHSHTPARALSTPRPHQGSETAASSRAGGALAAHPCGGEAVSQISSAERKQCHGPASHPDCHHPSRGGDASSRSHPSSSTQKHTRLLRHLWKRSCWGWTEHQFIQPRLKRVNLMKLGSLFPFSKFWLKYQLQK